MRCWPLAIALGLIGVVLGKVVATGAGQNSQEPLWMFSGGAWLAILGAILGGTMDIVSAITRRPQR